MRIEEAVVRDLQLPDSLVTEAISLARQQVKKFQIEKKSGGKRTIYHPSKKLKTIQYWLVNRVFCEMPVHHAAMAYREGCSILHNAKAHARNRFFVKMDLKDFFPSIRFKDLLPHLEEWHAAGDPEWELDDHSKSFINKVCFYQHDRLAIGYPTSPIISNIVMQTFDRALAGEVTSAGYGNVIYTRYADDIVLSTDKAGVCNDLVRLVSRTVKASKSPKIFINPEKTRVGSSAGGSASVTGLRICGKGHITINRKLKSHIRLLLSLYTKGSLRPEEVPSLAGHLAYCHYVAPQFYSSLAKKYFNQIHEIRARDL